MGGDPQFGHLHNSIVCNALVGVWSTKVGNNPFLGIREKSGTGISVDPPCHSISLDPASNSGWSFCLACQRLGEGDWDSLASLDIPKHTLHSDVHSALPLNYSLPGPTRQLVNSVKPGVAVALFSTHGNNSSGLARLQILKASLCLAASCSVLWLSERPGKSQDDTPLTRAFLPCC